VPRPLVKAATAEGVSSKIIQEVESWIVARGQGCLLVSSVAEADVVLELEAHSYRFEKHDVRVETWQFVARQLASADPRKAIQRFELSAIGGQDSKDRLAERLPVVLKKLLGQVPEAPPKAVDRI